MQTSEIFSSLFAHLMESVDSNKRFIEQMGTSKYLSEFCVSMHTLHRQTGKTRFLMELVKTKPYNFVVLVRNEHLRREYEQNWIRNVYTVPEYVAYLRGRRSAQQVILLLDEVLLEDAHECIGELIIRKNLYAIFGLNTRV